MRRKSGENKAMLIMAKLRQKNGRKMAEKWQESAKNLP
jgi:hypothetical protein